jgi:hypothetical protein
MKTKLASQYPQAFSGKFILLKWQPRLSNTNVAIHAQMAGHVCMFLRLCNYCKIHAHQGFEKNFAHYEWNKGNGGENILNLDLDMYILKI